MRDNKASRMIHFMQNVTNNFLANDGYSKASALSFYTLLSIVPILAVAFGIAKGFGFEELLETQILETFYQQQAFAEKIIGFARSTLEHVHGSIIAGVGVLLLFWSALGVLGNLERAFNRIWKVTEMRSLQKRIVDYLPILIFAPIFAAISSSLTFFMVTKLVAFFVSTGIYSQFKPLIFTAYYFLLLMITWAFYSFLYIYIPNKYLSWKPCIIGAFIAACTFQLIQWSYIHLQIYLTSYNAIYGSFAAIPLFLLWIQISWLITLSGAEIAAYEAERPKILHTSDQIMATEKELLVLTLILIFSYFHEKKIFNASLLAEKLNINLSLAEHLISRCIHAGLIVEIINRDGQKTLLPISDPAQLSLAEILHAIDLDHGIQHTINPCLEYFSAKKLLTEWEDRLVHLSSVSLTNPVWIDD